MSLKGLALSALHDTDQPSGIGLQGTALKSNGEKAKPVPDAFIIEQVGMLSQTIIDELQGLKPPAYPKGLEILAEFRELFGLEPDQPQATCAILSDEAVNALLNMDLANYPKHLVAVVALLIALGVKDDMIKGSKIGKRFEYMTKHIMPSDDTTIEDTVASA